MQRPPLIADLLNEELIATIPIQRTQKVVRITTEEMIFAGGLNAMIPDFVDGINLPEGGYLCSLAEIEERFVYNDCRRKLFGTLITVFRAR